MIGWVRRGLAALLGGRRAPSTPKRSEEPARRIDAAKQRLKETIPPPEEE